MSGASAFTKDPEAVLDYAFDWSAWLEDGESIASYTITVPDGITKDRASQDAGSVTCWLSGGTAGKDYPVVCQITTSLFRTDERTILIKVRER